MPQWFKRGSKKHVSQLKNVSSTLRWVQVFSSIFSLGVFEFPHGKQRRYFTALYIAFATTGYFTSILFGVSKDDIYKALGIEIIISVYVNYINIFIAAVSVVICLYKYPAMRTSQMKIDNIDKTLHSLGISRTYRKEFMTNMKLTIAFIIIDIILHAATSYLFLLNLSLLDAVAVAVFFNYPFQISLALDLVFITNNGLISTRLKKMNIFMEDTVKTVIEPVNTWKVDNQTDSRVTKIKIINSDLIRLKFINSAVQTIRQAHQDLCDIAREFNEQLSVQVTVEMAGCFGLFTGLLYNLYVTLFSHHDTIITKVHTAVSLSLWSLIYIGKVFFINRSCTIAVVEAKKIGEIIHKLDSPIINDELRNEVHQFALQMIQNPLIFTGCGFFSLNYSFVQSFVGSVTTYLVILIQMSNIPSKPDVSTELSTIYENSTEWW